MENKIIFMINEQRAECDLKSKTIDFYNRYNTLQFSIIVKTDDWGNTKYAQFMNDILCKGLY